MDFYTNSVLEEEQSNSTGTGLEICDQTVDELVERYIPLIKTVAYRILCRLPPTIELDDLVNSGVIGLMDAIKKYDPRRDNKFETYAVSRIQGEMLDGLRLLDWVPRNTRKKMHMFEETYDYLKGKSGRPPENEDIADFMGISLKEAQKIKTDIFNTNFKSLEEVRKGGKESERKMKMYDYLNPARLVLDITENLEELAHRGIIRETLRNELNELPETQKLVVDLYYEQELTMKEIGMVLGVTESRVSQIHSKALDRLRRHIVKYKKILDKDDIV